MGSMTEKTQMLKKIQTLLNQRKPPNGQSGHQRRPALLEEGVDGEADVVVVEEEDEVEVLVVRL
jgi:hypothetical protein